MPQTVTLTDGRTATFPDGMSKDDMAAALKKIPPLPSAGAPAPGHDRVTKGLFGQDIHEWQSANGAGESNRPDSSLLGLPPELAVVSGLGVGRAMVGQGLSAAGRAMAGAKAAAEQAAPAIKYEATRSILEKMGVPAPLAVAAAIAVSGYKRGAKAPAATSVAPETEAAARVSPAASTPAAPTPPAVTDVPPVAPSRPAGSELSPQRIRNEVGMAERRSGLTLTEAQRTEADRLMAQGLAPKEAVQTVAAQAPAAPAPTPTAAPPTPAPAPKLRLSAAESKEYTRLIRMGKTHPEAVQSIEQQRAFAERFGTPSAEDARKAVAERNATGRWRNEE